jgi:hypothetical protein
MPVEMNEGIEERILDRIKNNRKIWLDEWKYNNFKFKILNRGEYKNE